MNFSFHANLSFNLGLVDSLQEFYKQIIINWSTYFVSNSKIPSCIQSNCLWQNRHLWIHNRPVYVQSLADRHVNFLDNLLDGSGNFKSWNELKTEFKLADNLYISWMQLINSIVLNWRTIIKSNCNSTNVLLFNHHVLKKRNLINLDKLYCWELYNILVSISPNKPTSQIYFENLFREQDLNWKEIYVLPWKVSLNCYVKSFYYKVLKDVVYMNKTLFTFGNSCSPLWCFCKNVVQTIFRLFYECNVT